MTPYEQVVIEEAAKWFPDCEDLLIWAWDEDGPWSPGTCPPLDVVAAWDFDWKNLANPEFSNTCVISTDDGRYLYEPWTADLMSIIDELRPEPDTPSYFMLLYRNRGYIQVWVHQEGVFTEIRFWHDIVARRFTHLRASSSETPIPCRELGGIIIAEENLLPLSVVTELALAFHSNPSVLPKHPGVFWHVAEQALLK